MRTSEATRDQIMATARDLFMRLGFRAVSTRQVAVACGLTQPALYHHFRNKEDLFSAVLRSELDRLNRELTQIALRPLPGVDQLHEAAQFLIGSIDYDASVMVHDIAQELSARTQDELRSAFLQRLIAPLSAMMSRAQAEGSIAASDEGGLDPMRGAFFFLNLLSFVRRYPNGPDRNGDGTAGDATVSSAFTPALFMQLLLHGMGPA